MSVYGAILTPQDITGFGDIARPHVTAYQTLQEHQSKSELVRTALSKRFAGLSNQFTEAADSYERAKNDATHISSAANEFRVLLDKLKGELFQLARNTPAENMTWEKMSFRLGALPSVPAGQKAILDQEQHRPNIYTLLSDILKKRQNPSLSDLHAVWPLFLDHVLIVLESI
jgi:hypothetical protein